MRARQKNFVFLPEYYETIYRQKDYRKEAEIISFLIRKYLPNRKEVKILDVGCGTGQHLLYLDKKGYQVSGLDNSLPMLNFARDKFKRKKIKIELFKTDARCFSLKKKYDVIISLFHVLSYQNTNQDVISFFSRIHEHLVNGGLILFDLWYGSGVLTDLPQKRHSTFKKDNLIIHRLKEPKIDFVNNLVRIKHSFSIENKMGKIIKKFQEIHNMRYFFYPEIKLFLKLCGFKIIKWGQFGKRVRKVKQENWDVFFMGRKSRKK